MPDELFKSITDKTKLINDIYELLSKHVEVGHGKINCIVALQANKEVFHYCNIKNEEAKAMFTEMIRQLTESTTKQTTEY